MNIGGFQKLSATDFPGRICSLVFTGGCLFRCSYCSNTEFVTAPQHSALNEEQIVAYLARHKKVINGVCITGGEPTMQVRLIDFIKKIRELGLDIKLDTNGIHPEVLNELIQDKLVDYIAMDLKAPWIKYSSVFKKGAHMSIEKCREAFSLIQNSGLDHEFRTTIFPEIHSEEDFYEMASYLRDGEKYYIQNFLNQSDFEVPSLVTGLRNRYPSLCIDER